MNETQKQMLKMLGQALRGEALDISALQSPGDTGALLGCAGRCALGHILYGPLCQALPAGRQAETLPFLYGEMQAVLGEANQCHAWEVLRAAAEAEGIGLLMLKGLCLKGLYPQPDMRDMCDLDVLVRPGREKALGRLLRGLGYVMGKRDACHDGYFNAANGVTVEAHHILSDRGKGVRAFSREVWDRALNEPGFRHIFRMAPADLYAHLILHTRLHLREGTHSLRQLADLYVLKHHTGMDSRGAEAGLQALELLPLAQNLDRLTEALFTAGRQDIGEPLLPLADYFLGNLSFGGYSPEEAGAAYACGGSRAAYLLKEIFPAPGRIYGNYPLIEKHRLLLPAGYVYRLLQCFGVRGKNLSVKFAVMGKLGPQAAAQGRAQADFYRRYGA